MIEVRNVRVGLAHAGAQGAPCDPAYLAGVVARELGVTARDIEGCSVAKRAVDARRRGIVARGGPTNRPRCF